MFNSKVKPVVNGADESCFIIGMREQVTDRQMQAACEALSDLRKLIKEAEGQKTTAYVRLEDWGKEGYEPEDCFDRVSSGFASTPLYTALGEKP